MKVKSHCSESGFSAFQCGRLISAVNGPHHPYYVWHGMFSSLRIRDLRRPLNIWGIFSIRLIDWLVIWWIS